MEEGAAPVDSDAHLWVSWEQYHALIEELVVTVHRSDWTFDHILCLARGGLRIGDVLSRVFDRPLAILAASSYRAAGGTVQGRLDIAEHITSTQAPLAGRVLVADDLVDSGKTLQRVCAHLQQRFGAITELRTAVLWWKPVSLVSPDYYVRKLPANPWIHQPFERYDGMEPDELYRPGSTQDKG